MRWQFRPTHGGWTFGNGPDVWVRFGQDVDLDESRAAEICARVPGLDGQPCLVLLDEPTPATSAEALDELTPVTPRRRKPRAEG